MLYRLDNNQVDVVEAFNSTSRYLDYLLNINDLSNQGSSGISTNKANSFDIEVPILDFDLSLTNDIVSSKCYDKLSRDM